MKSLLPILPSSYIALLLWKTTFPLALAFVCPGISPSYGFSFLLTRPHHVKNSKRPLYWSNYFQSKMPNKNSALLIMSSNSNSNSSSNESSATSISEQQSNESSATSISEQQCNTGYEYSRALRPTTTTTHKQQKENGRFAVGGSAKRQQQVASSSPPKTMRRWRIHLSTLKYTAEKYFLKRRREGTNDDDNMPRHHQKRTRKRLNKKPGTLILVRAGESEYAKNHTFTGWADPELTQGGRQQMEHAGRLLLESGYEPDIIYTSRLKRAIQSVWVIVQEISAPYLPVYKSWRLNGRHYGALTGLCKKETSRRFGVDQVQIWRTSLTARPPPAQSTDWYHPQNDRKYSDLLPNQIPLGESLLDCIERTRLVWDLRITNDLKMGNNVMVVAHANTLRGLVKVIDEIDDDEITQVSFPNGIPFVYKFDKGMKPIKLPTNEKDNSFTQVHTSGTFLEKPDLLKKAMGIQKQWEQHIPGVLTKSNEERSLLPDVTKCMTTLEIGLLKLREEQQEWSRNVEDDEMKRYDSKNDTVFMTGSRVQDTHVVAIDRSTASKKKIKSFEERFEEDSITNNQINENITLPFNHIDATKEPVVVLIRHGRTPHNKLALFTGWEDPPLAKEGVEDARNAGQLLKKHGYEFDVVYSSWLYRAIQTAYYVLEEMDSLWLPLIQSWRLNERHYGALTGKSKKMVSNIHGEEQLKKWRKGYTIRPPSVSSYSFHYPGNDVRRTKYVKDLRISFSETLFRSIVERKFVIHRKFPKCESLKDCMDRSIPFYTEKIVPEAVAKGKRVLITSHENAIRGILMHLCEIPEAAMTDLHLPNGVPLIYSVRRKCISILDDGTGIDPVEKYDFGSAAKFLFRPCELTDDDFYTAD